MEHEPRKRFESFRRQIGPVQNQVIDDLNDGEFVDRKEFLQRGTFLGLSASALSAALVAAGEAPIAFAKPAPPKVGGRLKVGVNPPPSGAIEPHEFMDSGRIAIGSPVGEFLTRALGSGQLVPELAVSWKPNADASVWTVKLRPNVRFQSGQTLSQDDVIATYKRLLDAAISQAASAFKGILSQGGVTKGPKGDEVVFKLDNPSANFPYTLSSNTYQAIILPADYQVGTFVSKPQATGAFKLTSYTPAVGATYDRFDGWWRGKAALDGVDATIYASTQAQDAALVAGTIDLIQTATLVTDPALFGNPNIQIFKVRSAAHTDYAMRVDRDPFKDWRIRQAIALTIDRPAFVNTLYGPYADIGNDHPFATVFRASVSIAQRRKDIGQARQLLAAAGKSKGFSVQFTVEEAGAIPQSAEIIRRSAKEIGVNLTLKLETDPVYFAGSQTTTPWLNDTMTATGWGHRAVPNFFLSSALLTGGSWNESHYSNPRCDAAIKSFLAAIALKDQRKYAKQIETIVQHDTPVLYLAFTDLLTAGATKVKGFTLMPQSFYLSTVSLA
jgi:peptide/nickel transport system substrate-binding protein